MLHNKNNNTAQDLPVLVQSDKLQLLYKQSSSAIYVSIVAAMVVMAILWPVQDHRLLLTWFGLLMVSAVARMFLFSRYRKISPSGKDVLAWEAPYFITLMLASVIWGIGSLVIMPYDSPVHQAIIFGFLIGMSGGAISLYSSHSAMTLATITIILLPATGYFLIYGSYTFVVMGIGGVIFYLSAVRATRFLSHTLQQNLLMTRQLKLSSEEAQRLARVDDLTGLLNRRAFYEYGKVLTNKSQRDNEEISMIHMDVDNFKMINDTFGHTIGDAVLKQIGKILLKRLRKSDICARVGGEEFCMLLPKTSLDQAALLAEELRLEIEQTLFATKKNSLVVTVSLGVTSGAYDVDALVRQSDELMYQSKESGRNRVTCYQG